MSQPDEVAVGPDTRLAGRPLRLWPVLPLLAVMALTRLLPQVLDDAPAWIWMMAAFGPVVCGLLILLWWVSASRATWRERVAGIVGIAAAFGLTLALLDASMMGPGLVMLTIPMGTAGFALGALASFRVLTFRRTLIALLVGTLGLGYSAAVRNTGMWGNYLLGLRWRWEPSDEAPVARTAVGLDAANVDREALARALAAPEWPGFRGAHRDGIQPGARVAADWTAQPPEPLWKIAVGPGWSSFAVAGPVLYTQEQRGGAEAVVCYGAESGQEIWAHTFEARFDDPLGGPGPRATPTLADGALYALGATGILARLNPDTGDEVWRRDVQDVAGRKPPMWGFSSSPLAIDSLVVVHAGGAGDKGILAFDAGSGELKWSAPAGEQSYSSPQRAELLGEPFVLCLTNTGLDFLAPSTGVPRLQYAWPIAAHRVLQPQVVGGDTVVVPSERGEGTRRIRVARNGEVLSAAEVWTSRGLKPDFNDFVIHDGHAYGFDGAVFTSINLETGEQNWRGGRYGKGQVLLLEDGAMLLVLSEKGEVVLLKADPAARVELARFDALEGKTWNHPVVVGDRLYVRNSQEAAAYRLPLEATTSASVQPGV